jgi:hypothetical protein
MRRGWFGESYRHYLAAKGLSSSVKEENRALLKKWQLPKSATLYVEEASGKLVAGHDKKSGKGEALSQARIDRAQESKGGIRGVSMSAAKGKYFGVKRVTTSETPDTLLYDEMKKKGVIPERTWLYREDE